MGCGVIRLDYQRSCITGRRLIEAVQFDQCVAAVEQGTNEPRFDGERRIVAAQGLLMPHKGAQGRAAAVKCLGVVPFIFDSLVVAAHRLVKTLESQ
jgi:hypothetical protein